VAIPIALFTAWIQGRANQSFIPPPLWERPLIALDALGFYLKNFFFPVRLAVDYGRTPSVALADPGLWLNAGLPLLAGALLYATFRRGWRWPLAGAVASVAAFLPVLGLIPFLYQTTSTVADRYNYLALLGPALIAAWALREAPRTRGWVAAPVLILVVLGARGFAQSLTWRGTETLWAQTLKVNPQSWLAYNNLGSFHEKKREWAEALALYQKAAELKPIPAFFNNMGSMAMNLGKLDEAQAAFERSIAAAPYSPIDYLNLSMVRLAAHDPEGARQVLRAALERIPDSPELKAALYRLSSDGAPNQ
jgi:tetratricopeptide (TPR) repeat protein